MSVQIGGGIPGYHLESRQVGVADGFAVMRDIYCRGNHNPYCQVCENGWVCDEACTIEDMDQLADFKNLTDTLIEVEKETKRHWFSVYWSMTRVSLQRTFVNGRCMVIDLTHSREMWHKGKTLTKWGARRQMKKYA